MVPVLQTDFQGCPQSRPSYPNAFAKETTFSVWVIHNRSTFCSWSASHLGLSHPGKWESSLLLAPPIPSSLAQVDLPSPTTLSAFATHSIIPWPLCFSKAQCSPQFFSRQGCSRALYSMGGSGVSSLGLRLQRWLFYFDVFLLATVWCITHPTQCAMCITQCSYERSKQWDARAAVICLKMSPFWESQAADKICQSTVTNIVKTGKDSFQTFFTEENPNDLGS